MLWEMGVEHIARYGKANSRQVSCLQEGKRQTASKKCCLEAAKGRVSNV